MRKTFLALMIGLVFSCFMMSRVMAEESVGNSVFDKYDILNCETGEFASSEEFAKKVLEYNVVYALESHGRNMDHTLQKELAELMVGNNSDTVLVHEHFYKNTNDQKNLNFFKDGAIDYDKLCERIPVLYSYSAMRQFLEMSPTYGVKFLAVNIPIPISGDGSSANTITVKYLREKLLSGKTLEDGYTGLSDQEKSFLPKNGFKILCDDYFHGFIFGEGSVHGGADLDIIHTGFWVMNETMARSVLDFFENSENMSRQLLFATGRNHGIFKGAIRVSVEARNNKIKQLTILPVLKEELDISDRNIRDVIVKYPAADYILSLKAEKRTVDSREDGILKSDFEKTVNELIKDVGELIGLPLKNSVQCEIISPDQARDICGDNYSSSIKGFYINNTLYLVDKGEGVNVENSRALIAHEGVHAIQDQHFGLFNLHKIQAGSSPDKSIAIEALIEGHAVYGMLLDYDKDGKTPIWKMLDQPFFREDGSLVDLKNIMKYRYGGGFVKYLYEKGGWDLVYSAFTDKLPESTEQIMHPEKYLSQEKPAEVFICVPEGWTTGKREVMGEINIVYTLLTKGIKEEDALRAAKGWNGDLYAEAYDAGKEKLRVIWKTAWDTENDLNDFFDIYIKATNNVFGEPVKINDLRYVWLDDNGRPLRMIESSDGFVTIMSEIALKNK